MRWTDPPLFLRVMDGSPASRFADSLIEEGHSLIEVNGEPVQGKFHPRRREKLQEEIAVLFNPRPLLLKFRRTDAVTDVVKGGQIAEVQPEIKDNDDVLVLINAFFSK